MTQLLSESYFYKEDTSMICPYCEYKESKVLDSRHIDTSAIRRRRELQPMKR